MIQKVKNKILELKSSEYVRNVATLATGTTIAQLISVGTAPILYRIYSKEDYGTLGTYVAIVGVIGVFSTLRYNEAIMLEEDDQDAKKVLWLNRYINIIFTLLTIIIVLIGSGFISHYLNNLELKKWLYFIPISIFFSGQNEIFKVWANRKKEYKLLTINSMLNAVLIPIISISLGIFLNSAAGLFIGLLLSQIIPTVLINLRLSKKYNLMKKNSLNLKTFIEIGKKHINFPLYSLPADFVNKFSNQLPVFFISKFMGSETVALYNLSVRVLGIPIQLISNSIGNVFREKFLSSIKNKEKISKLFKTTIINLAIIGFLPFTVIFIFGEILIIIFFGEKWAISANIASILSPLFFFTLIVSPISYIYYFVNKQKEDLINNIYFLISTYVIFVFTIKNGELFTGLILYSINYVLIYVFVLWRCDYFIKKYL